MTSHAPTDRPTLHPSREPDTTRRSVVPAMYAGLALTVIATLAAYVDRTTFHTLADHIRAGYPSYTQAQIETAATTFLVYLTVVGGLGVAGWLWSIHAVSTGRRWARATATTMFVIGTSVALVDLVVRDTSGDTGLPQLLGVVGVLPCLPGLLAVTALWRRS